jgi:hypothetical protein
VRAGSRTHRRIRKGKTNKGKARKRFIAIALTAVEMIRGEKAEVTVEARLKAAFREMGYENEDKRKVHKVMGKLHDDIRRVLHDQRAATQTHAALPIVHTSAPPAVA